MCYFATLYSSIGFDMDMAKSYFFMFFFHFRFFFAFAHCAVVNARFFSSSECFFFLFVVVHYSLVDLCVVLPSLFRSHTEHNG